MYTGPVVQTQDLTVFNVTQEAIVARQVKQFDQLPPTPGKQRTAFQPVAVLLPPDWWAEALIPLDQPAPRLARHTETICQEEHQNG